MSSAINVSSIDPVLLRRALRLVHCLQKERGASCAYYASRHEQNIVDNMDRARVKTDRAIQMMLSGKGEFKVHATLMKIRKMVQVDLQASSTHAKQQQQQQQNVSSNNNSHSNNSNKNNNNNKTKKKGSSCHRILVCFNALISSIVHDYFMEKIALQQKTMQIFRSNKRGSLKNNKAQYQWGKSPVLFQRKSSISSCKKGHDRARSMGDCLLLFSESQRNLAATPAPPPPPPPPPLPSRTPFVGSGSGGGGDGSSSSHHNSDPHLMMSTAADDPSSSSSGWDDTTTTQEGGGGHSGGGGSPRRRSRRPKRSGSENSPNKVHFDLQNPDQAEEVLVRLLNILACFVKLKESTGVERAVLSSLVVSGQEDSLLLSDLVLEVENQRRLLEELKSLPFGSLRNLVEELVEMSIPLRELQQKILTNFDLDGIIILKDPEHDVTAVWDLITVYIDKLHSLELLIIEEIEYCLPSIESSNSHERIHTKQALLESEFIVGLYAASQDEAKKRLEAMPAEEVKQKLLEGLVPNVATTSTTTTNNPTRNGEHSNKSKTSSNGSHHKNGTSNSNSNSHSSSQKSNGNNTVPLDDPLLLIPNLPASKEWEINLYELKFLKRLAEGAQGTTYLAKWTGLEVAVKVASITEHGLEGWRTEVQALQKLHHPNIIRLLGSVYHPNPLTFCLVLEYCNSGDLATALKYPTAPNFFFHVAISIAKGVAYLHSRGVMHRDIKPDNILIDGSVKSGNFQVKVSDFGVATDTSMLGDRTAETGTYRWMAPEVLRHESYSNMADVYSFAVVLWQLVTREGPYANFSQIEAAGKVALERARPPFPSGTPKAVMEIIETCWSEDPDDRWAFDEVCDKLPEKEVSLNLAERKWLDAPLGHPVYYPREETTTEGPEPRHTPLGRRREDKAKDEKKKSGFFRIKMFGH